MQIRESTPTAKIVAMSGGVGVDGVHPLIAAKTSGAVEVLAKPFSMSELSDCVGRVLTDLYGEDKGHALAE
jgi:hypothetical protein